MSRSRTSSGILRTVSDDNAYLFSPYGTLVSAGRRLVALFEMFPDGVPYTTERLGPDIVWPGVITVNGKKICWRDNNGVYWLAFDTELGEALSERRPASPHITVAALSRLIWSLDMERLHDIRVGVNVSDVQFWTRGDLTQPHRVFRIRTGTHVPLPVGLLTWQVYMDEWKKGNAGV